MLSRIAESLFWLARYIERAEDTARILDVNYHMLLEQSQQPYRLRWEPLISMAGEENRFWSLYDTANAESVFEFLAFHGDNPGSIVECIAKARENARTIRDRISREMWEDINGLYYTMTRFDPKAETFKEYTLPGPDPSPYAVAIDKNDNFWYSSNGMDSMGRLDPKTGQVIDYPFPYSQISMKQFRLDPQGRIWWVSDSNNNVGYFYLAGSENP